MTLHSVFEMLEEHNSVSGWIVFFLILTYLIDISKLQINPWKCLGRFVNKKISSLGKMLTADLIEVVSNQSEEIKRLTEKTDKISTDLDNHIAESMRRDILDFQNSCINSRKHTREEWTYIHKLCGKYEEHVEKNELKNSEAEEAIRYIRHVYRECLENGKFVINGEINSDED